MDPGCFFVMGKIITTILKRQMTVPWLGLGQGDHDLHAPK